MRPSEKGYTGMKTVTEDKVVSVRRRVLDAKSLREVHQVHHEEERDRLSFKLDFSRVEKAGKVKTKGKS